MIDRGENAKTLLLHLNVGMVNHDDIERRSPSFGVMES